MGPIDSLLAVPLDQSNTTNSLDNIPSSNIPNIDLSLPDGNQSKEFDVQKFLSDTAAAPSSSATQLDPTTFDWDKSNAERYVHSNYITELGFDPYAAPVMRNGKSYDANELKYDERQTAGDVAWKAVTGGNALFWDTFGRQAMQWKNTVVGLYDVFNPNASWDQVKRDFIGTDEELMQMNKEQKEIMDKYAIFHGAYEDQHLFSKEWLGDNIQQFGLGAGQGAEMGAELLLTWGAGAAFDAIRAGSLVAKGLETANIVSKTLEAGETVIQGGIKTGEAAENAARLRKVNGVFTDAERQVALDNVKQVALDVQKMSEMSENKQFVNAIWNKFAKPVLKTLPGSGLIEGAFDIGRGAMAVGEETGVTGAKALAKGLTTETNWGVWKGGLGGMAKELSLFNMASTHGKLLAFTTYGQQYGDLVNEYQLHHDGKMPDGEELNIIKNNAWIAANNNFTLNLGLIMFMGKIQWGGIYSKFGSVARNIQGLETSVMEGGESGLMKVKGKWEAGATHGTGVDVDLFQATKRIVTKDMGVVAEDQIGKAGTKEYIKATGMFPAIRTLGMVRKDFGLGTALWEGAKIFTHSSLAHFEAAEVAEGLHLVLQNASDKSFREYYKKLYDGGKDINGISFLDATRDIDWGDAMKKEFSLGYDPGGGWKTFIMGFSNGLLMAPLHQGLEYGQARLMSKINPATKDAAEYRKSTIATNAAMMNTWYKDPNSVLNVHIDAIKSCGQAAENMSNAVKEKNEYAFHNSKDDLFAKTVSTFIKTGNYNSFLYTLKQMGNMNEKDFYDAVPNMKPINLKEGERPPSPKEVVEGIANNVTDYYNRWQSMVDKYANLIKPEYFEGRGAASLKISDKKREEGHAKIEEDYKDVKKTNEEHAALSADDQVTNKARYEEMNNKHDEIDATYKKETEGNQYHQKLMQKRTLDEAIEVMATTDYHSHAAVKQMLDIKGKMMDANTVGEGIARNGNKVINILGSKQATVKEIRNLKNQIKVLEPTEGIPVTPDKIVTQQLSSYKEQLKHLTDWLNAYEIHESHGKHTEEEKTTLKEKGFGLPDKTENVNKLKDAHNGYVFALNNEIGEGSSVIATTQYQESLNLLTQHINYSKDYSNYLAAINIIADPKGFQQLYGKIFDGMEHAIFSRYQSEKALLKSFSTIGDAEKEKQKIEAEKQKEEQKTIDEKQKEIDKQLIQWQKMKITDKLSDIEKDIQKIINEKTINDEIIEANEKRAKELQKDIEIIGEFLKEGSIKKIEKHYKTEAKRIKQQIKKLQETIDGQKNKKQYLKTTLAKFNSIKEYYGQAIKELEETNQPFEKTNFETDNYVKGVKNMRDEDIKSHPYIIDESNQMYKLDYAIQETEDELKVVNSRIEYFQSVIDTANESLRSLLEFVSNTDKGGALQEKFIAKHLEQQKKLQFKLDNYTKDLKDAQDYKDQIADKLHYLTRTKQLGERVNTLEEQLHYIRVIKKAFEEGKINSKPINIKPEVKTTKEEKVEKTKLAKEKLTKIKTELVNKAADDTVVLSNDAQEELDNNQELQDLADKLEAERQIIEEADYIPIGASGNESTTKKEEDLAALKEKADKEIQAILDDKVEFTEHPEFKGFPKPFKIEDGKYKGFWKVSFSGTSGTFKTKQEANDYLEKTFAELLKEPGSQWGKIPGTEFHKNQFIYSKDGSEYYITGYKNSRAFVERTDKGTGPKTQAINELSTLFSFEKPEIISKNSEQEQAEETKENPPLFEVDGKLTSFDPMKINYDDINSIDFHRNKDKTGNYTESRNVARERLFKFITDNKIENLNDVDLSLKIISNKETGTYNPTENPNIRVNKISSSYSLNLHTNNKQQTLFIMPNGVAYEFNIADKGESENWIKAKDLDIDQFFKFFNVPSSFSNNNMTTTELFKQFKYNIQKVESSFLMKGDKKEWNVDESDELKKVISLNFNSHLNYSGEDLDGTVNTPSPLSEVLNNSEIENIEYTLPNGDSIQPIIVNNGLDAEKQPFVGGINGTETLKDPRVPQRSKYPGMYSFLYQIPSTKELKWIELSPSLMNQADITSKLLEMKNLITNTNGDTEKDVEGGVKAFNNILLNDIFIPLATYKNGNIDFSQKWAIRPRATQKADGKWSINLGIEETFGLPSERSTTVLKLDKVNFDSPEEFAASINRALQEDKIKDSKTKQEISLAHLHVDSENFRNQVNRNELSSIMKMSTNVTMENSSIVKDLSINWQFIGKMAEAAKVIPIAVPQVVKQIVYTIQNVADAIKAGKTLSPEAQQFRINNAKAIEELLKQSVPTTFKPGLVKDPKMWTDYTLLKSYMYKMYLGEGNRGNESVQHQLDKAEKDILNKDSDADWKRQVIQELRNEYKNQNPPFDSDYTQQSPSASTTTLSRADKNLLKEDHIEISNQWFKKDKNNKPTGNPIDVQAFLNDLKNEEPETKQEKVENPTNNPPFETENDDFDFNTIEEEKKKQERPITVNKIVANDEKFDATSIENIDNYISWIQKNIPSGIISVENLGIFANNLKDNNITVGTFSSYMEGINQKGKISLYENSPFKYHEAFHAIFRLLLPEQKIQELLNIAKKENPPTEAKLNEFRERGYNYNKSEIADRFAEEYMADKFEAWKQNHKTQVHSSLKGFFTKIVDFFKEIWAKLSGNKLEGLFYEINRGKYRKANLQENSFTGETGFAISQPAMKSIYLGTQEVKGKTIPRFLPQQTANKLSSAITGMFLQHLEKDTEYKKSGKYNKDVILDKILDMHANVLDYNTRKEHYKKIANSFTDVAEKKQWMQDLVDRYWIFSKLDAKGNENKSRQEIKESVDQYLQIMGLKQKLGEEQVEEDEMDYGENTTEKLERENAFSLGGFGSLPTLMRKFIGTTTFTLEEIGKRENFLKHDSFYNTKFLDGTDMIEAVDANKVYNGMLKCMANTSDLDLILRKLMRFVDDNGNPETSKFVNYLMNEAKINIENYKNNGGVINNDETANRNILQQVIKAFNQYTVNTYFIGVNGNDFTTFNANTKDAAFYQMSNWQNAFNSIFQDKYIAARVEGKPISPGQQKLIDSVVKPLQNLVKELNYTNSKANDVKLKKFAKDLSSDLKNKLGIDVHESYIYFSILKSKLKEDDKTQILSPEQQDFVMSYPTIPAMIESPVSAMIKILEDGGKNIFTKDETGVKSSYQSLNYWAEGNAIFDESINMMSHKNVNNDNVTNYVQPFYGAVAVTDMNKGLIEWKKSLLNALPEGLTKNEQEIAITEFQKEIEKNPLIKQVGNNTTISGNFQELINKGQLSVEFLGDLRSTKGEISQRAWVPVEINEDGTTTDGYWEEPETRLKRDKDKEGKTYSDFSDRDFIASLLSFYNVVGQNDCQVYTGKDNFFYKVAVPIRVPAEKSMFAIIKLPVIHSVKMDEKGKIRLTDGAFDVLYNRVEEEFKRIQQVYKDVANDIEGHFSIEDWNTGDLRGTKLFHSAMMCGDFKEVIEKGATNEDFKLFDIKENLRKQFNEYFLDKENGQVKQLIDRMISEKMMDTRDGEYTNEVLTPEGDSIGVVPDYLFRGFDNEKHNNALYFKKDNFVNNISQLYMNSFLNTSLINNLIHGDESRLYKNQLDAIKRESGTMAVGPSIEGVVADPSLGITKALKTFHHLTISDEEVFKALTPTDKLKVDDGHGLCTAKGYLYMLYGKGTLNKVQADMLKKLRGGALITPEEFFASGGLHSNGAFNSLKMVHFDGQVYLKFSVTPLTHDLTSVRVIENGKKVWKAIPGKEELHNLRLRMEAFEDGKNQDNSVRDTIVITHPMSSSKMLTRNVFKGTNYSNVQDSHFEPLQAKYFKEQLQNPSGKTEITDPTQPKWQLPAEQELNTLIHYRGKNTTVGDVIKEFMISTSKRIGNNFTTARDSLFKIDDVTKAISDSIDSGKVNVELSKFLKIAKENLEATGTDSQMLEFMELDANGQPKYNINFPSILPKITSIFFSYFSRGVLREKVPGMSLAIVSPAHGLGTMIKEVHSIWTQKDIDTHKENQNLLGQPKEWTVITQKQYANNPTKYKNILRWVNGNKSDRLFSRKDIEKGLKSGQPVYVLDDIRDNYLKFKNGKAIGRYSEALIPAHNLEVAQKGFTEETKYGFGTRIPYVDKNSATTFEYVDQLPVHMGSIMVVPREYYERTGADNDIDKDYVSVHDTYTTNKGERVQYGNTKVDDEKFTEYIQYMSEHNKDFKRLLKENIFNNVGIQQLKKEIKSNDTEDLIKHIIETSNKANAERIAVRVFNRKKKQNQKEKKEVDSNYDNLIGVKQQLLDELSEKTKTINTKQEVLVDLIEIEKLITLKQLDLPISTEDFIKKGGDDLNNGVLNNKILDAKIAMLNNESTVKNQNTVTTTDPLKDIIGKEAKGDKPATGLIKDFESCKNEVGTVGRQIYDMLTEKNVDVNSILGMVNDRSATMMGADSIGAVATTNIVYSFLNHMKIDLRSSAIKIDGNTFNSFAETKAWNGTNYAGERIFAALACLTNTMTDNPKERNANKLNLGKAATGMAAYLIATGIPEKTAYLLMIQPSVIKYMGMKKGGVLQLEGEKSYAQGWLENRLQELKEVKTKEEGLTTQDLINNIKNNEENEGIEKLVLQSLQKMETQSETFFKVARVLRLTQGIKGNMEDFDTVKSDLADLGIKIENGKISRIEGEAFDKLPTVVDVRDALLSNHDFAKTILDAIKQLDACMPSMFLERTQLFRDMTEGTVANLQSPKGTIEKEKLKRDIKNDLLSYIAVRAYKYALDKESKNNSLNHGLIFQNQGTETIVQQAKKLKLQIDATEGVTNYLLSYFLVATEASEKTKGIDLLEANTWAQLSDIQQERLIGSFVDLYQDAYKSKGIETHDFANAMFNYLLVKDGGQFNNGSFLRMLPPFIFRDIMTKIGAANKLMSGNEGTYEELFGKGVTEKSMLNDFLRGYTTHVANRRFIVKVSRKKIAKPLITTLNENLTVNAFGGIRDTYEKGKPFTDKEKEQLKANKEKLSNNGFKMNNGELTFPMSFQFNNKLYTLKEVTKRVTDKKTGEESWGPVSSNVFIQQGEFAPLGLRAKYVEHNWEGSTNQFPAASAVGKVPAYVQTKEELAKIAKDNKGIVKENKTQQLQSQGYDYVPIKELSQGEQDSYLKEVPGAAITDAIIMKDGKYPTNSEGKIIRHGNFETVYNFLNKKSELPLKSMSPVNQQNLFSNNQQLGEIEKPIPGVEVIKNSGLTVDQSNNFIDLLQPNIDKSAYKENKSLTANHMFANGLRWTRHQNRNLESFVPIKSYLKSKQSTDNYVYDKNDVNGNPVDSMKSIQPIIDYVQSKLGIDMQHYDVALNNIYKEGQNIDRHADTTESVTAKKYPVIVLNLGADGNINMGTDINNKNVELTNGSIYAFGVNGENRFITHGTDKVLGKTNPLKSIIVDGKEIKDYRITLTFRRAQDLTKDIPETPKRFDTKTEQTPIIKDIKSEVEKIYNEKFAEQNNKVEYKNLKQGDKFKVESLEEPGTIVDVTMEDYRRNNRNVPIPNFINFNFGPPINDTLGYSEEEFNKFFKKVENSKTEQPQEITQEQIDKAIQKPLSMSFYGGIDKIHQTVEPGKSMIQLIREGKRTQTSRDINTTYNKELQSKKPGDLVVFEDFDNKDKNSKSSTIGQKVLVRITTNNIETKSMGRDEFSKQEGWVPGVHDNLAGKTTNSKGETVKYESTRFEYLGDIVNGKFIAKKSTPVSKTETTEKFAPEVWKTKLNEIYKLKNLNKDLSDLSPEEFVTKTREIIRDARKKGVTDAEIFEGMQCPF